MTTSNPTIAKLAVLEGTDILADPGCLGLLWRDPDDLDRLYSGLRGAIAVMGRSTFDAMSKRRMAFAGVLDVWVLTRAPAALSASVYRDVLGSDPAKTTETKLMPWFGGLADIKRGLSKLQQAPLTSCKAVQVLGGVSVYQALLPYCTLVEVTVVSADKVKGELAHLIGADTNIRLSQFDEALGAWVASQQPGVHQWKPIPSTPSRS